MSKMLREAGAAVILRPSRGAHGTMFVQGGGSRKVDDDIATPSLVVAAEHYGLIARLLEREIEVKLEVTQDGRVTATVIADKADTLDMLQRDSRALERALQEAGLHTDSESLNFGLRDKPGHDESGEGDQHADGQNDDGLDDIDVHGVIPPPRPLSAQAGALDIFV